MAPPLSARGRWHRLSAMSPSVWRAWLRHRVLITPHSAFYTPQSQYDMRVNGVKVALKYLTTGRLENCVNEAHLRYRRQG